MWSYKWFVNGKQCILMAASDGNFVSAIFLNGCFSKTATVRNCKFIYLFIYLFSICLSLTNFISSYNQTSLPQTARLVSNIRCDQQHCGMLLSLTPDIWDRTSVCGAYRWHQIFETEPQYVVLKVSLHTDNFYYNSNLGKL